MAKKAPKPKNSAPTSASASESSDKHKMVLRIRRTTEKSKEETIERPVSAKRQKKTPKKKNSKIDAKMPKKPPTAFFYFLEDFRKEYQEQNPNVKSMRDIGKACGEKWKTMTYEEKVQYYDVATEKRAEFDRAMAEYIKRKESGEDQESEEESEYE
ncbi:High mobility group box domain [Dillenia turbinata]|uniref:High mobility group box domain n=1 Tax=Dillenia turbinata TaxID=194707 RepID=A0AAN8YXY0_9MAGN